jgi:uncharacterized protein YaiE (UPF0345 family)
MAHSERFNDVSVVCKANIYFDGGVISHTVYFSDGSRKTLGLIRAGEYKFDTGAPELMQIVAGTCRVKQKGQTDWTIYGAGTEFKVPGKSLFDIAVDSGIAEYICSFLPE